LGGLVAAVGSLGLRPFHRTTSHQIALNRTPTAALCAAPAANGWLAAPTIVMSCFARRKIDRPRVGEKAGIKEDIADPMRLRTTFDALEFRDAVSLWFIQQSRLRHREFPYALSMTSSCTF